MNPMLLVRAYPRLHFGLLDLGNATPRRYGGAGVVLDCLPIEVGIESGSSSLRGVECIDADAVRDLRNLLTRVADALGRSAEITIRSVPQQHVGLGTKTALSLAIAAGCAILAERRLDNATLQRLSGRGGVSGIGIHGFFQGGFLVDGGHIVNRDEPFAPSSARTPLTLPVLNVRKEVPAEWLFGLALPQGLRYCSGNEVAFFRDNTPVPASEVASAMASLYHCILPSFEERDLQALKGGLRQLHRSGFKRRELAGQAPAVRAALDAFSELPQCAVGMSSMGPLLYAVFDTRDKTTLESFKDIAVTTGCEVLAIANGRNEGHEVQWATE